MADQDQQQGQQPQEPLFIPLEKAPGQQPQQQPLLLSPDFMDQSKEDQAKQGFTILPEEIEFQKRTAQENAKRASNIANWVGTTVAPLLLPALRPEMPILEELPSALRGIAKWEMTGAEAYAGGAAGAAVGKGIEKAAGVPGAPTDWKDFLKQVNASASEQAAMELALRVPGGLTTWLLRNKFNPYKLYTEALRPGGTPEQYEPMVRRAVNEEVPLTRPAWQTIKKEVKPEINKEIEAIIANSPTDISPGQYVNHIKARLNDLRATWGKNPTKGRANIQYINNLERNFLEQFGGIQLAKGEKFSDLTLQQLRNRTGFLPAKTAQEIKQGAWLGLRSGTSGSTTPIAFVAGANPSLEKEVDDAIGASLRIDLENIYPELKTLNAEYGEFKDLEAALRRYFRRVDQTKMGGGYGATRTAQVMGRIAGYGLTGAGLGAAEEYERGGDWRKGVTYGGIAGLGATYLKGLLDNPEIKANLAILLNRARKRPGSLAGYATRLVQGAPGMGGRALIPYLDEYKKTAGQQEDEPIPFDPTQFGEPAAPSAPSFAPTPPGTTPYRPPQNLPQIPEPPAEPEEPPTTKQQPMALEKTQQLGPDMQALLQRKSAQRVPAGLALAIASVESGGGGPGQTSPKGAQGLMQLMPETQRDIRERLGYNITNPMDPEQSAEGGVRLLKSLMSLYRGNIPLVIAAYNMGPQGLSDWQRAHAKQPFPDEVKSYVTNVMTRMGYDNPQFDARGNLLR